MPRGGYRNGAGRPIGSLNKTTSEQSQRLSELAKDYTHDALLTLVDVAKMAIGCRSCVCGKCSVRSWLREARG